MNSLINIGIIITYIFVGLALAIILFFAVKALVADFKSAVVTLVGLGVIVSIFLVSYLISNPADVSPEFFEKRDANPAYSKILGSGLIMLYLTFAAAVVAIIYAQVSRIFKK